MLNRITVLNQLTKIPTNVHIYKSYLSSFQSTLKYDRINYHDEIELYYCLDDCTCRFRNDCGKDSCW
ncbi:unnamed protein product [Rotaria sordida]|uniref:Uncharacterized protein n=1 Tax=Rotaria sordida TaxID=392033 RepID=A0A814A9K0_9BILA|nr:unnamed protein product [Rotaria sordida]